MPRPERLLDPTAGPLEAFAHDLRILRRRAGNPSYRTMAKRAHYSVATLAEAARGLHKPSLKVTLAYVAACGGDEEVWSRRWHSVSSELEARDVLRRRRPGGAEREAPREPLRAGRRRPAPSPPGDAPDPGPGWHRAGGTGHPPHRGPGEGQDRTAGRAVDRGSEWVPDRPTDRGQDRATDRTTDRTTDRASGRRTDQVTGRATDRAADLTTDGATGRTTHRAADRTTDRAPDRGRPRAADLGPDRGQDRGSARGQDPGWRDHGAPAPAASPAGRAPGALSGDERAELCRLRSEVEELRRANEVLKAASAIFATDLRTTSKVVYNSPGRQDRSA